MTALREIGQIVAKQASACLFGLLMLGLLIGTHLLWPADAGLARYDFIFIAAVAIQIALLWSGMETLEEAKVILIFHIVGTVMELYKTQVGSWIYPEENLIRLGGVPLFTGFMYSAIGSYIARMWRLCEARFTGYPWRGWTFLLCAVVYINFFAHHYVQDIRWILFAWAALLWGRCWVHATPGHARVRVPLLLVFLMIAVLIWVAENIGTYTGTWLYPHQRDGWEMVSLQKVGSWFLLMLISWVLVTIVRPPLPESVAETGRR